ncbi:MAG: ATP-dependent Clp protease ATP-binding subunit, partial [Blastococcus sp.]|nr:ATP-dependent Clp protease ATP-binding subunit [Blastococcus sp.]
EDALSEKILYGELTSGQIIVVDVEEDADASKSTFTFRGEAKPIDLPDTPPVALTGADAEDEGPAAQAD